MAGLGHVPVDPAVVVPTPALIIPGQKLNPGVGGAMAETSVAPAVVTTATSGGSEIPISMAVPVPLPVAVVAVPVSSIPFIRFILLSLLSAAVALEPAACRLGTRGAGDRAFVAAAQFEPLLGGQSELAV